VDLARTAKVTLRVEDRKQFTVVDSRTINDRTLSLRARGLLVWLLDKPDGWRVNSQDISKHCPEGREAIRTAIAELEQAGYLTRLKYQLADGQWFTETVVRELPESVDSTDDRKPVSGPIGEKTDDRKPDLGFPGAIISTKSQDYKETNTYVDETLSLPPRSELQLVSVGEITKNAGTAERVMEAWVEATGRAPGKVKLNAKRRAAVAARLREGYTEEDLIAAARGIALSAWHMGDNPDGKKFDDLLVAIRDGERVERFRDIYDAGGERGKMSATDQVMALYAEEGR
jgi:hypothetical protein